MAFEHDKIIRIFVEKYLKNIEKKWKKHHLDYINLIYNKADYTIF
jgi:hypothetical protein